MRQILADAGVVDARWRRCEMHGIGIAGVKGFGGGFGQRALGPWGETIIKQFVHEAVNEALKLEAALGTAADEPSDRAAALLADPADGGRRAARDLSVPRLEPARGADQSLPGLAGLARPRASRPPCKARTNGGVPVYNVSMPLLTRSFADRPPFRVFEMPAGETTASRRHPRQPTSTRCATRRRNPCAASAFRRTARLSRYRKGPHGNLHRARDSRPGAEFYIERAAEARGDRHSVSRRRRVRLLALFARAAQHEGHRRLRQAGRLPACARGVRAAPATRPSCRSRTGSARSGRASTSWT